MIEVKGKYNNAKIFTDLVDDKSIEQVKTLLDQEFVKDSKIRMMPDIHAGSGCTIGTTMTIKDKICPNLVGVDIGCGMYVAKLSSAVNVNNVNLEKLDKVIRKYIPSGFNIHNYIHFNIKHTRLGELWCYHAVDIGRANLSLGTLGGGNHFIELAADEDGRLYLIIHSGSRHLGVDVCNYYQNWAIDSNKNGNKLMRKWIIDELKREGREQEISNALSKIQNTIPDNLCWVSGRLFDSYIDDMKIVQEYAKWNRITMGREIAYLMHWDIIDDFETVHNYIDTKNMILRKGAVSAQKGEQLIIPMNMRDGSLICVGKGNPDWNYSAPHGAGRLIGRMEAKRRFSVDEFKESMDGIYTTSVGEETLDECPMAYKPMESIVNNIGDTVDILKVIKPVYNFKASN